MEKERINSHKSLGCLEGCKKIIIQLHGSSRRGKDKICVNAKKPLWATFLKENIRLPKRLQLKVLSWSFKVDQEFQYLGDTANMTFIWIKDTVTVCVGAWEASKRKWPWSKGQNQLQNKALHWNKNPTYFPHVSETQDGVVTITNATNKLWYDNKVKVPLK